MARNKKPRKSMKQKKVLLLPMVWRHSGIGTTGIAIKPNLALIRLKENEATLEDMSILQLRMDWTMTSLVMFFKDSPEAVKGTEVAIDALSAINQRQRETAVISATEQEIGALANGIIIADEVEVMTTRRQSLESLSLTAERHTNKAPQ